MIFILRGIAGMFEGCDGRVCDVMSLLKIGDSLHPDCVFSLQPLYV